MCVCVLYSPSFPLNGIMCYVVLCPSLLSRFSSGWIKRTIEHTYIIDLVFRRKKAHHFRSCHATHTYLHRTHDRPHACCRHRFSYYCYCHRCYHHDYFHCYYDFVVIWTLKLYRFHPKHMHTSTRILHTPKMHYVNNKNI